MKPIEPSGRTVEPTETTNPGSLDAELLSVEGGAKLPRVFAHLRGHLASASRGLGTLFLVWKSSEARLPCFPLACATPLGPSPLAQGVILLPLLVHIRDWFCIPLGIGGWVSASRSHTPLEPMQPLGPNF